MNNQLRNLVKKNGRFACAINEESNTLDETICRRTSVLYYR